MNTKIWPFYVSYSWKMEEQKKIIKKMQMDVKKYPSLNMILDKDECEPGDSISAFLEKVGQAPRLILVLSKSYFESEYTLKEFVFALKLGGLNTRVRVVIVEGFRFDQYLSNDDESDKLQTRIHQFDSDFKLDKYKMELASLRDTIVSITDASDTTNYSLVFDHVLESFQRYPNPEIDDAYRLKKIRESELLFLRKEIKELFSSCEYLEPLVEKVRNNAVEHRVEGKTEDILCPVNYGDEQQLMYEGIFHPALADFLEELKRTNKMTDVILEQCTKLVGWVITGFVNDIWIQANGVSMSDKHSTSKIYLSVGNGHLVELFIARANKRYAGLLKSGSRAYESKAGLVFGVPGANTGDKALQFVFQQLMLKFMPDKDCNDITEDHWKGLDARLRMRRYRENIFITFESPEQWKAVRAELEKRLRGLPQIWLQQPDQMGSYLLMPEFRIDAFISESINLIEEHRKHVKSRNSQPA